MGIHADRIRNQMGVELLGDVEAWQGQSIPSAMTEADDVGMLLARSFAAVLLALKLIAVNLGRCSGSLTRFVLFGFPFTDSGFAVTERLATLGYPA